MGIIFFLIGIFLFTRLFNLSLLPIFADEAIYIRWAQLIGDHAYNFFIPLSDGKTPLFMWLLAPWLKLGADSLLAGRLLSVVAGLATLIGIYGLTKALFNRQTALIAAILVIFQPFLLFYDRISLTDSLLTALTVWTFYFTHSLISKPTYLKAILLGLLSGAVLLTKPSGLLFLLLNALLLSAIPLKTVKSLIKPGVVSALIALGIYNLLRLSDAFFMINQRSQDYLRSNQEILHEFFRYFLPTFSTFFSWLVSYLSWPAIILIAISLFLAIRKKMKLILILFFWALVPLFIQVSIGKIIYPRYLLPTVPFILIILGWGLRQIKFGWLLIFLFIFSWLKFDYLILTKPDNAPFHQAETEQYFNSWASGYGLKEITRYLKALPQTQPILVATEGSFGTLPNGLEIYFNRSDRIKILGVGFPDKTVTPSMDQALAAGKKVFLVVNSHRFNLSAADRLTLINEYPRPGGEKLVFYEVH